MKSYLPLEKAATIASRPVSDMELLCKADKLDCRKTHDGWFVSEEEIVDTLSMMNGAVLDAELKDLRNRSEHHDRFARMEKSLKKLSKVVVIVLLLLFGAMAAMTWGLNIAEKGSFAASIYSIWR